MVRSVTLARTVAAIAGGDAAQSSANIDAVINPGPPFESGISSVIRIPDGSCAS